MDRYQQYAQIAGLITGVLCPLWLFAAPHCDYRVVASYPHDTQAFTQGLIVENHVFYESTGLWGQSNLRQVDLTTGQVMQQVALDKQFFGEGLTRWDNQLIQLTWKAGKAFVYDMTRFERIKTFHYAGEGWGLTHDNVHLIMSDGTNQLRFLNPDDFSVQKTLAVFDQEKPIIHLNELEYVKQEIFANIWHTDLIAMINPETGQVNRWLDLTALRPETTLRHSQAVLNGIAYDVQQDRLFVTGKWWPTVFEIKMDPC
ncbi:glutaminyl-peptide cyclotransferase [Thioflexithrix psekupsensis]|uniref:Glutamine cyclotransferase n=1 Tax=Thioflexithrix psekupsensis TaxID=1570016 RepID=A0A251X6J1_9GAMM|nr:glutaminyl-peptide cyclotransferase [Thioflexithrix psekupsensis]OUD13081.1 hypothetical protein TPSD3_10550 [Thioflexithrix psekupsensis]